MDDVIQHVVDVDVQGGVQSGAELGQERSGFDRVAGVGAEVVQEAVDDIALLQSIEDIGAALIALDHDEKVNVGEALDQRPVVAVARHQNDRIDTVSIDFLAGARGEGHINLRFPLIEPHHVDTLDRKTTGLRQDVPARRRILTVKQQNLRDFRLGCRRQAAECSGQLDGVGILTVYNHDGLSAFCEEVVDVRFHEVACVPDKTDVLEAILPALVEQGHELFVAVQDVAIVAAPPVDIALEWILVPVFVVLKSCCLDSVRFHAAGHQEDVPDIFPVDPVWEQRLHRIDSVTELPVDCDDIFFYVRP